MTSTRSDSHDDGAQQSTTIWPLPKFTFTVQWDGLTMHFQEVSGMEIETHIINYRAGNSPVFAAMKIPGGKKFGPITMKKGIFKNDTQFWDWYNANKLNTAKRADVVISLLDAADKPIMVWTLTNAYPTKISGTDLKSTGNDVAIETIEIAHEGIALANA